MSKRKYTFAKLTQEQLAELEKVFPKAVTTITTRRPVYSTIAKLLDCGVEVPGVQLVQSEAAGAVVDEAAEIKEFSDKVNKGKKIGLATA